MSDTYAVVRGGGDRPTPEILADALRGVPGLTPYDAKARCNDSHGIIARGLTEAQAGAFRSNLQKAGVAAETIKESQLPVLPSGKLIRQVEFTPDALIILDLLGRKQPVDWKQVNLVAAGSVQLTTFSRERQPGEETGLRPLHFSVHGLPQILQDSGPVFASKESTDWFLRADLILLDGITRFSFEAEKFMFTCLGDRMTKNPASNFCLFVRELAARASEAALNDGAAAIASEPPSFGYYPRKSLYFEEMIWMLWRAGEEQEG